MEFTDIEPDSALLTESEGRSKKSDTTRDKIFKAGLKLIRERGYQATHIRDICKEAGFSVRTFYLYFDTKSDIVFAVTNSTGKRFGEFIASALSGDTHTDRLRDFLRHYAKLNVDTDPEQLQLILSPEQTWHSDNWKKLSPSFIGVLEEEFRQGQESGEFTKRRSADELARHLAFIVRGVVYVWCCESRAYDLETAMLDNFEFLLPAFTD